MRTSDFLLATQKETPSDAEVISHQLMLRAGMIRKLAAGLYTWLPMGLRVLRKVEYIVRDEMNKAGALEVLMPAVQPSELWQESGRWDQYGPELLRINDRHNREFCFGPTHEEVITELFRREVRSYKQLPVNFYQIQTKFRDEIRPRFGVMRAREFIMKDAYSFHTDQASLQETYERMHKAYCNIFDRLRLDYRPVLADTGSIGGNASHEFHVLAESGEDAIAFSTESDYAANVELAEAIAQEPDRKKAGATLTSVDTPGKHSIEEVSQFLKVSVTSMIKTLVVKASDECEHDVIALVIRGDHDLNAIKASKLKYVATPFRFASDEEVQAAVGCKPGSIVNWGRDLAEPETADIRNVVEGDPSPDGRGSLQIKRGIEVGHIFQLGKKYSQTMNATILDESGKAVVPTMGCYGIGVTRVVAAAIEQNHDDRGIIWNESIAPFHVVLVPINMHKSQRLREAVDSLYQELIDNGFEVLLDDRKERPGVMFADMELIGIPHRVVFSEKGLDAGSLEYKGRQEANAEEVQLGDIVPFLKGKIAL